MGIFDDLFGGGTGPNWARGGIGTILGNLNNATNSGQNGLNNFGNTAGDQAKKGLWQTQPAAQDWMKQLSAALSGYQQGIPGQMNKYPQSAMDNLFNSAQGIRDPEQSASNLMRGGNQGLAAMMPTAIQNFQSGGWTPQYQQAYDALGSLLSPGGSASNLINNFGQTDFNINAQSMANNMLGQGGWTPQLGMGLGPTQGILASQGNTGQSNALASGGMPFLESGGANPGSAGLFGAASPFLQSGGQTALTNNMAGRGTDLYSQQALMSPEQAAGLARNQAATQYGQQEQQAEQQALARGGGAGATVANGLQNQGMADFYNQASQGTSNAVANALNNQQGLNLTQQGQGINLAQGSGQLQNSLLGTAGNMEQGGGGLQNAFLGTGGNLMQGSGGLANNLFESGLGNVNSMSNAAANTMSPYVQYGSAGMGNQLGMLGAGSNLELGGLGALNNTMGNQNQYQLGMGNLQNTMTQGGANSFNNLMGTGGQLNSILGNLGLGQFGALTGAENAGLNTGVNMGNAFNNMLGTYFNPLTAISGQFGDIFKTGLTGQAGIGASNGLTGAAGSNGTYGGIGPLLGLLGSI